jgi:hypothetical protein
MIIYFSLVYIALFILCFFLYVDTTHGTLDTSTRIPVSRQKKAGIQTKYPWIPGYRYSGNTEYDSNEEGTVTLMKSQGGLVLSIVFVIYYNYLINLDILLYCSIRVIALLE